MPESLSDPLGTASSGRPWSNQSGTSDKPGLMVDREGRHVAVSAAYSELLGLPGIALIGRRLDEFTADGGALVERGLRYLDAGLSVPAHEVLLAGRRFLGTLVPVRDDHGQVVAGVVRLTAVGDVVATSRTARPSRDHSIRSRSKWVDELTGLPNRRAHAACLIRELHLLPQMGDALSVVVVDIDDFVGYVATGNDAIEPEDCIRLVAETIAGVARRPADVVCWLGDSRFSALLPHTDAAGAFRVAERIRDAVRDLRIVATHRPGAVLTVSAGAVTTATSPARARQAAGTMMTLAESALQQAQALGPDQAQGAMM